MDITTVADDVVVIHDGAQVLRYDDLSPGTGYTFHGHEVVTLERPAGELLCRIATTNDVHFGETECGRIDDNPDGPIQRSLPGEAPYPDVMNAAAVAEIAALDPAAVIVKGDITRDGQPNEFAAFETHYRDVLGQRLHVVRGNHDAYRHQSLYAGDQWIEVPGLGIALMDTVIPGHTTGRLGAAQLDWLETHAAAATTPVLVMGHHQQWIAGAARSDDYFGLHPDSSDGLQAVVARQRNIIGYAAGHTHRHRVRRMDAAGGVASIEVGCVKDFPGTWAEYRVYETGVMQVVHRISAPAALAWSERCRHLYSDFGIDYEQYALGHLEDRCFTLALR